MKSHRMTPFSGFVLFSYALLFFVVFGIDRYFHHQNQLKSLHLSIFGWNRYHNLSDAFFLFEVIVGKIKAG